MKTTKKINVVPMTNINIDNLVDMLLKRKGATFVRLDARTIPDMATTNNPFWDKSTKTMNIVKDSSTNAMIGVDYENLVNNARNREAIQNVTNELVLSLGMSEIDAKAFLDELLTTASDMVNINPKAFEPKERKWGKHMQAIDDCGQPIFELDEKGNKEPVLSKTMVDHTDKNGQYKRYMQIMSIRSSTPIYRYADSLDVVTDDDLQLIKSFLKKPKSNAEHQGLKKEIKIRDYTMENIRTLRLNKVEYVVRDIAVVNNETPQKVIAETV